MTNETNYQWIPGAEIPLDAIERMRNRFRKPPDPMGEAWFMGEKRELFTELVDKPFDEIEASRIWTILFELSSGTFCFGHSDEWDQWFKFLLPDLILRSHNPLYLQDRSLPSLVTSFMSIYWKRILEEYPGFRDDIVNSLSLCLMNKVLWSTKTDKDTGQAALRARFLDSYPNGRNLQVLDWNARASSENLSSMMFFCIKYLNTDEIPTWVESLFQIDDSFWKGALSVWLLGALDLFKIPIVTPNAIDKAIPTLDWENSHVLTSSDDTDDDFEAIEINKTKDFLPRENVSLFFDEVQRYLTDELIVEWADLFSTNELLVEATYTVPESLMEKLSEFSK